MGGGDHLLPDDGIARRASQERTALIEATKRLLVDAPSGTFGIREVTRDAGVPRSAFHDHFTSVDDLIATTCSSVRRDLSERVAAAVTDSPDTATAMVRGMVVVMCFGALHPIDAGVLSTDWARSSDPAHPVNRELARALDAGVAGGELALRDVSDGLAVVRGLADIGLARIIQVRDDAGAVRELVAMMCGSLARAIGVDADRIDALVDDAMQRCVPAVLARRARRGRHSGGR